MTDCRAVEEDEPRRHEGHEEENEDVWIESLFARPRHEEIYAENNSSSRPSCLRRDFLRIPASLARGELRRFLDTRAQDLEALPEQPH